jgi:hypothetical protein
MDDVECTDDPTLSSDRLAKTNSNIISKYPDRRIILTAEDRMTSWRCELPSAGRSLLSWIGSELVISSVA